MASKNLDSAKKNKKDEFYTQISDIEKEIKHYKKHFKGATVFCNCDDPEWSNFWRYFHLNFAFLGLKKLISTHYENDKSSYKMEYEGGNDNDWNIGTKTLLNQNGDFRSPESLALMDESDIIVTNPPFSLFREYVATLIEHDKKFLILGNVNAVSYKEIFPLIKDNKMWSGCSFNKTMEFVMPDDYELKGKAYIDDDGKKHGFVPAISWYTNLDHKKRHEPIDLVEKYDPDKNPKYDNCDAIEVSKVLNIPIDYDGIMGVPITFIDKYDPDQFEIIGAMANTTNDKKNFFGYPTINGKRKYARILIRKLPED